MNDPDTIPVFLNPLTYLNADKRYSNMAEIGPPNLENLIRYICHPDVDSSLEAMLSRYKDIVGGKESVFAVPFEEKTMNKIIWPLKSAKVAYVLGNYLGTIALSGLCSEMLTILVFEIAEVTVNNQKMDETMQKKLFGSSFEKQGQTRRLDILRAYELVSEEEHRKLKEICAIRRKYLHFLSQDHRDISKDAKRSYKLCIESFVSIVGQSVEEGHIVYKPLFKKYISQVFGEEPVTPSENEKED